MVIQARGSLLSLCICILLTGCIVLCDERISTRDSTTPHHTSSPNYVAYVNSTVSSAQSSSVTSVSTSTSANALVYSSPSPIPFWASSSSKQLRSKLSSSMSNLLNTLRFQTQRHTSTDVSNTAAMNQIAPHHGDHHPTTQIELRGDTNIADKEHDKAKRKKKRKHKVLTAVPFLAMLIPVMVTIGICYCIMMYLQTNYEQNWQSQEALQVFNQVRLELHLDLPTVKSALQQRYFELIGEIILHLYYDYDPTESNNEIAEENNVNLDTFVSLSHQKRIVDLMHVRDGYQGQNESSGAPTSQTQLTDASESAKASSYMPPPLVYIPGNVSFESPLDLPLNDMHTINSAENLSTETSLVVSQATSMDVPVSSAFSESLLSPVERASSSELVPKREVSMQDSDLVLDVVECFRACEVSYIIEPAHRKLFAKAIVDGIHKVIEFPSPWAQMFESRVPVLTDYQVSPHPLFKENCYSREISSTDATSAHMAEPILDRVYSSLFCCGACTESQCAPVLPGVHRFVFAPWVIKDHMTEIIKHAIQYKRKYARTLGNLSMKPATSLEKSKQDMPPSLNLFHMKTAQVQPKTSSMHTAAE